MICCKMIFCIMLFCIMIVCIMIFCIMISKINRSAPIRKQRTSNLSYLHYSTYLIHNCPFFALPTLFLLSFFHCWLDRQCDLHCNQCKVSLLSGYFCYWGLWQHWLLFVFMTSKVRHLQSRDKTLYCHIDRGLFRAWMWLV